MENSKAGGRVSFSKLKIRWPYEVESGHPSGKRLLYLMDPPVVCCRHCYFDFNSVVFCTFFFCPQFAMAVGAWSGGLGR